MVPSESSHPKGVYNPKAVVLHAALLPQACAHWGKFLAAASRRSLGRVAVPVCPAVLSDRVPVSGLVRRYHTNYLMGRRPLPERSNELSSVERMRDYPVFRRGIPHSGAGYPRVPQPFATQPAEAAAFDLHALGTPPAFVLSQDQTLHSWTRAGVITLACQGALRIGGNKKLVSRGDASWR